MRACRCTNLGPKTLLVNQGFLLLTKAQRHGVLEKTVDLNQPIYYKDVKTSEWKSANILCWAHGLFLFHRLATNTGAEIGCTVCSRGPHGQDN